MNLPPSRREASHERIVEAASRDLRKNGYAGVGVADVMAQAGLTHGGFYAHFDSRDALLAEAIARAGRDRAAALAGRIAARPARRAVAGAYCARPAGPGGPAASVRRRMRQRRARNIPGAARLVTR